MADMIVDNQARIDESRKFLTRLWHLENDDRPGMIIGDVGGEVIGGRRVRSALFSTEGSDTVRDRLQDPEKYLRAQMDEIEGQLAFRGDVVPALCPSLGVAAIPSAFGCEVVWWERNFPAVRGRVHDSVRDLVRQLNQPETSDGELRRVLEHTEYFLRHTSGRVPIRLTDIQGPLDSAALVLGHSNFLLALRAEPRAAHALLQKVTDLTIAFSQRQRELVRAGGAEFVPAMFQPWMPDGWGISISNDECVMISREMHDEFAVPYLNQLSDAFGGIYVHSCGDWTHQFSSLENVRHLRGLEFGASEVPFERVLEHWAGRAVLAARVGLHRERKFNGMVDFVTSLLRASKTNRGLFLNVDITNGIVERSWPATDVQGIYRMVGL